MLPQPDGEPPLVECLRQQCPSCRGAANVQLPPELDGCPATVQLQQWEKVEDSTGNKRVQLVARTLSAAELLVHARAVISQLLWHQHVAERQAAEWRRCLDDMREGECIISMDFSENAALAPGEEIQNNYWNRTGATLFIAITWHWPVGADGPIKTVHSFISPDKKHDHR